MLHAITGEINGFASRGVSVGSATRKIGGWLIRLIPPGGQYVVWTEDEARRVLRDNGAVTLRESDGTTC